MSLPSDPAARKAIKKCMDELSASMARIDGERDFIKEVIDNICERCKIHISHLLLNKIEYMLKKHLKT